MVGRVPLEGLGQEVCSGPAGSMLLLPWGGVSVNYVIPHRLGASLLWGRGSGLGLLGGGSLCHVGGLVFVDFIVVIVNCIVVLVVVVVVIVVGLVVDACIV